MLSPIAAGCFAAVLLSTSSLASSIAIAFGNPTFAGITFGHPYNIEWFGGNGMPATIRLLTGNPAALKTVATLATGVTASPYRWTPVASKAIRSGQLYALSIEQSGLTNYSPMFGIGAHAASDALQVQYGAPVPIGFGRYYPLENRAAHNDNFNTGAVFPRTEGIFRHGHPTGTPVGTEVSPAYPTGTPAGSNAPPAHATGTSTGAVSGLSGAARATYSPPITGGAQTTSLGWSNLATLALVFVGCVSALLRI